MKAKAPGILPEYQGLDAQLARLARFFIRNRQLGIVFQVVIAGLCIWAIWGMRLRDDPNAWPPRSDPFVRLNDHAMGLFGGGNSVSIELAADKGTIYTQQDLATIKGITDDLQLVKGIIPYAVRSIASLSSERYDILNKGTPSETMFIGPVMADAPTTDAEVKKVEEGVTQNPLLNGVLVSKDGKAALILADFRSVKPPGAEVDLPLTEPAEIYRAVQGLIKKYQRPGITLRAAGEPMIIGWVNSDGLWYVLEAFAVFVAIIGIVLWYGFRSFSGVVLPLRVALLGVGMGFGAYRLFFGATLFSASALIAPFIIVAAGACHSVQFLTRFFHEEYPRLGNTEDAIVSTFVSRLRPMLVSLLCDVVPFAVMAFIPFDNVRMLGLVTMFGLLSLTFDEFAMMIPSLSYVTSTELEGVSTHLHKATARAPKLDAKLTEFVRRLINDRKLGMYVVAGSLVVTGVATWIDVETPIGQNNTYAIHNYLTRSWLRSDMYTMEREITGRFGGVYPMTVLVEGKTPDAKILEDPRVVHGVDLLAEFLRKQPHVGYVADLAFPSKLGNQFIYSDDPKYFTLPDTPRYMGSMLLDIADRSPGGYLWLFTNKLTATVVIAYVSGTESEVADNLIKATQVEADRVFQGLPVQIGVAGGAIGIAEAFNRNIKYWLIVGTALGFIGTLIIAIPFIGSLRLAGVLVIPLLMGTLIALAIMTLAGIEINSNAIAALAIASGVGIDSEVYLLFRVREEYAVLHDFREALVQGYVKIRRALLVSNGALILGCFVLIPVPLYIGYVGFGMGLVLALCFVMSAVLSPILWARFGEQVVMRGARLEADRSAPIHAHAG